MLNLPFLAYSSSLLLPEPVLSVVGKPGFHDKVR